MSNRDRLIALGVVLIWGMNFLAVQVALRVLPPIFLAGLRYLIVAVPVIVFVPRPVAPVRWLVGYGIGFGVMQFGLLFTAIKEGMPSGMSSVVLQMGSPIAVILGVFVLGESVNSRGWASVAVAALGMLILVADRAQSTNIVPLLLTVGAAAGWALGTLSSRLAQPDSPLRFALWMSVVPPLPLLALSAAVEGRGSAWRGLSRLPTDWDALMALSYIVIFGTVVGAVLWSYLLKKYPAAVVAPYSMLVPIVGVGGAWLVFGETPTTLGSIGAVLVVSGVLIGSIGPQREGSSQICLRRFGRSRSDA